jgi:KDO2-lipid IV(A) lauroyltransferase
VYNLICMALEILWTPRLIRPNTWRRHVRLVDMADAIRLLTTRQGPLVFVTGHVGNWEIAGYTMAAVGLPSYTVARHIDNPYLNDFIFGVRERMGQRMIYKKGAAAKVPAAMDAGEVVCFVSDQDAGRKGVFVDFFGRAASTFKSIALMAMQYDCPLVVVGCRRVGTFQFEIFSPRIIQPPEWRDRDRPVHWITQEFAHAIEQMARACPEQYFWFHRRWKHRPKGEPRPPGGIA